MVFDRNIFAIFNKTKTVFKIVISHARYSWKKHAMFMPECSIFT